MSLRSAGLLLVVALGAAACGSTDSVTRVTAGTASPTEVTTPVVTRPVVTRPVVSTPPAIARGSVSDGTVEIGGVSIDYVASVPEDFEVGDVAPLLLALPPGGQDLSLARRLVENTYASEANRLGWVVVSPAAPDGQLFFNGSEAALPGFVDWIGTWLDPEGGSPHIAGVSNGGISAFRYAAENPERTQSIVTFPGFARSADDRAALAQLADVPIRMYVGGNDTSWVEAGEETVAEIEAIGGDVELTVFDDEGHIMSSTADGTLIFEQLEAFRSF